MLYEYKFLMRFYKDQNVNYHNFENELKYGKNLFNLNTKVGKITEFAVLRRGVVVTYLCTKKLSRPACALARLSRIWLQTIRGFDKCVHNKRIFHVVKALPIL